MGAIIEEPLANFGMGRVRRRERVQELLAAVSYLADRVAVMYLGKIVEVLATRKLLHDARHPYTPTGAKIRGCGAPGGLPFCRVIFLLM